MGIRRPLGLGFLCICVALGSAPRSMVAGEAGGVLVLRAEARPKRVRFGDPLTVVITLTNKGDAAITIPPGELLLVPAGWSAWGCGGTGRGNPVPLAPKDAPMESIVVPPKGSAAAWAEYRNVTALRLSAMTARFRFRSDDEAVRAALPRDAEVKVAFEVAPSELLLRIWAAKGNTDDEELRQRVRQLLRLRATAKGMRDRDFVENFVTHAAGYLLPFLEKAAEDPVPTVRAQAIEVARYSAWAVGNMNAILDQSARRKQTPSWAKHVEKGDENGARATCTRLARAGLKDPGAQVRRSALRVLTWGKVKVPLVEIQALTVDFDPSVRSAALAWLSEHAADPDAADTILASLTDPDPKVRGDAVAALEKNPKPPLPTLKHAAKMVRGDLALRLITLLFEREDASLPSALLPGFAERTSEERVAILTAIAGHTSDGALELVKLGLRDKEPAVRRAALLRLLCFPADTALPLLDAIDAGPLRTVAVRAELQARRLFPFLSRRREGRAAARETVFPSRNGTVPMVSPDGKWVAYVETGWGRAGGSGGFGRSNLVTLVHAVRADGSGDRLVSDLFLVGWLADSRRIASTRDRFAAICDLDGKAVAEFGTMLRPEEQMRVAKWPAGPRMPHRKRLRCLREHDSGEDGAFSPDGTWFGPVVGPRGDAFVDAAGRWLHVTVPDAVQIKGRQATWSPDGRYVVLMARWGKRAVVIDVKTTRSHFIDGVDRIPDYGDWQYRKCRWHPWSKDGSRLAFVRGGQVWTGAPDGTNARQLTFDAAPKAFPTFSRDGKRVAYVTWSGRRRPRGPSDIWVVDVATTLAVRATAPSPERIYCLDWLDGHRVIFDRVKATALAPESTLRRLDLTRPR